MLYMAKTRVTFRVPADLATSLRHLPNQTSFVEAALRDALLRTCPVCEGKGRVPDTALRVPRFRGLPRLRRDAARQLQSIVRLGKRVHATDLDLTRERDAWKFQLRRRDEVLYAGELAN